MKYRKKPVVIEARQFIYEDKDIVLSWAKSIQFNVNHAWEGEPFKSDPCIIIPTLEGDMKCSLGDWIIEEPFTTNGRKLYPCKPDIFAKTYEPLNTPIEGGKEIMTADEYKQQMDAIDQEAEKKKRSLMKQFALSNNPYSAGEIITDHIGSILIEEIKVCKGISDLPCCIYTGTILTKDGSPTKKKENKRTVYQMNIKA